MAWWTSDTRNFHAGSCYEEMKSHTCDLVIQHDRKGIMRRSGNPGHVFPSSTPSELKLRDRAGKMKRGHGKKIHATRALPPRCHEPACRRDGLDGRWTGNYWLLKAFDLGSVRWVQCNTGYRGWNTPCETSMSMRDDQRMRAHVQLRR